MLYFIIVLLMSLALISLLNPMLGLYAFFIIAYTRPQDFSPFLANIEPARWILLITFVSFLFNKLADKSGLTKSKQNWVLLGILLCILASRMKAIDVDRWWAASEDFLRVYIVFFLLINIINTPKRLKSFFVFFLLMNFFVALRFYISYKTGTAVYYGSKPGDITLGFLSNADDLGIGMVVALALSLIPIFYAKNTIFKGFSSLISICFLLAVLATHSRGAHIGTITVFITAILSQLRRNKLRQRKYAVGLLMVLLLFTGFIYKYRYTLKDSYTSAQRESDPGRVGRFAAWAAAKQMIKDHPLTGVGRGNFIPYWKSHYPPGPFGYQVAHNVIYEVTAEIGLIGLLFFLFFSLYGLKEIRTIRRNHRRELEKNYFLEMIFTIYIIGILGFYANGLFITVAFYWHIYVLVAMFISAKSILLKEIAYAKN